MRPRAVCCVCENADVCNNSGTVAIHKRFLFLIWRPIHSSLSWVYGQSRAQKFQIVSTEPGGEAQPDGQAAVQLEPGMESRE